MNKLHLLIMLTGLGLLLGVTPGWGGGPPNPTMSDAYGNTAGGTGALLKNAPDTMLDGNGNTAFGVRCTLH